MKSTFASPEWTEQLEQQLRDAPSIGSAGATWLHGPIALVIDGDASTGAEASCLCIRIHAGSVDGIDRLPAEASKRYPFVVGGSADRFRAVCDGSLTMVDGILQSKLRARGDLATLVRHRDLLDALANAAGKVETRWPGDDESPTT